MSCSPRIPFPSTNPLIPAVKGPKMRISKASESLKKPAPKDVDLVIPYLPLSSDMITDSLYNEQAPHARRCSTCQPARSSNPRRSNQHARNPPSTQKANITVTEHRSRRRPSLMDCLTRMATSQVRQTRPSRRRDLMIQTTIFLILLISCDCPKNRRQKTNPYVQYSYAISIALTLSV